MPSAEYPTDIEDAFIGVLLADARRLEDVVQVVLPEDIHQIGHAALYRGMVAAWEAGEPHDPVAMMGTASDDPNMPTLDDVGHLLAAPWSSSNLRGYADTIVAAARLRRAHNSAVSVASSIADGNLTDPDEAFAYLSEAADRDREDYRSAEGPLVVPMTQFLEQQQEGETFGAWVVPGMLRRRWRVVIAGEEGIGKFVVLRQIGHAIAAGINPWFAGKKIEPGRVLIIDLENPQDVIVEQSRIVNPSGSDFVAAAGDRLMIHSREQGMNILQPADRRRFERLVNEAQPDVLIVGPLYKLAQREGAKNDWDADAMAVINFLDQIRVRYDCALLLEHHLVGSGPNDRIRSIAHAGSANFRRWPEMSFSLVVDLDDERGDRGDVVKCVRYRQPRVTDTAWPEKIIKKRTVSTGHAWAPVFRDAYSD